MGGGEGGPSKEVMIHLKGRCPGITEAGEDMVVGQTQETPGEHHHRWQIDVNNVHPLQNGTI